MKGHLLYFSFLYLTLWNSLFTSCTGKNRPIKEKHIADTSYITVDSNLSDAFSFKFMDDDPVEKRAGEDSNVLIKRKAYMKYFSVNDEKDWIANAENPDIIAKYYKDSLSIFIYLDSYWTRYGLNISVKGKKFQTEPFESTDVVYETEPTHIAEQQKLILHKAEYSKGDSIYGYLYTRHIREDGYRIYFGGYFRAKVD